MFWLPVRHSYNWTTGRIWSNVEGFARCLATNISPGYIHTTQHKVWYYCSEHGESGSGPKGMPVMCTLPPDKNQASVTLAKQSLTEFCMCEIPGQRDRCISHLNSRVPVACKLFNVLHYSDMVAKLTSNVHIMVCAFTTYIKRLNEVVM